jgi:ferredoxin
VSAILPSSSPAFIGAAKPSLPITPSMPSPLPHVVVKLRDTDDSFHAEPGQTILEAAEANGVSLEHSCRSGTCGSCKMSVVSGSVDMSNEHALTSQEIADGYVLTCIGKPRGNLTLSS